MKIVIDATGGVLGRITSYAAKQALLGKEVIIVNCANVLISGNKEMIIRKYKEAMYRGGFSLNGPFFIKRSPERIVKRTVRGMLSYKQGRGKAAFDRIMCYDDVPVEFANEKKIVLKREVKVSAMTLSKLIKVV
ncbi:MAG: 50S ribosomal protein L13 [Nanoarchaeota archaeon]